jgi:hypothetical protein
MLAGSFPTALNHDFRNVTVRNACGFAEEWLMSVFQHK